MTDAAMITMSDLVKTYRLARGTVVTALDRLNLEVAQGEVHALLGPNGAGKSTAVQVLTTLIRSTSGRATIAGRDVSADPHGVRELIGASGQSASIDDRLTGRENLLLIGMLNGLSRRQAHSRADSLIEQFGLEDAADRRVEKYSGGMRRRVDIAGAVLDRPPVLFLDEPTTGLDPRSRQDVWDVIFQLRTEGTTVLLTTQYLDEADRLADTISVVDRGRLIAQGTAAQLKSGVGSARAEFTLRNPDDQQRAVDALTRVTMSEPTSTSDGRHLSVAVDDGARTLTHLLVALEEAGVELIDAGLRLPTLDDVFFHLTETAKPQETESRS